VGVALLSIHLSSPFFLPLEDDFSFLGRAGAGLMGLISRASAAPGTSFMDAGIVAIGFRLRGLCHDGWRGHFGHGHGGAAAGMATWQLEVRPREDWQRE